jgi:hypothetical protein
VKAGPGAHRDVLALVLGVLGTAAWHRPLLASGFDRMPGDRGDARAYVYLVEHWYQVFRGQAELLSPGMFYPVKGTIGYAETMFVHALPYSGLRLAGMDMFSALAVPLVLFNFLNYVACFFLLRRVLGLDAVASVAGAMFFAFNSPRLNHAGHYGFQASFFLPLVIACVMRFVQRQGDLTQRQALGLLAAAALSLALQFVISPYQGWFFAFWSCLFLVIVFSVRSIRRVAVEIVRRFWPALAGAALVFMIGLYPLFLVYMPVAASVGPRPYSFAHELTPDAWSLIQMGEGNYIWGGVSAALSRLHPLFSTELNVGIGLVPSLALLLALLWAVRTIVDDMRRPRSEERVTPGIQRAFLAALILATALFYVIGMKYWGGSSPWRLVYRFVPGADGLRGIARYVLVLVLPMSIAFAVVVHRGLQTISAQPTALARRGLTAALLAVMAFGIVEQFGRAPSFSRKEELSRLETLAASLPRHCAVFYVAAAPVRDPVKHEDQIDAMLISVMRRVPTLNGYGGHVPPGWSLREVEAPDYEQRIAQWVARHHVAGPVCRLEIGD